jgi:hypothetical protein
VPPSGSGPPVPHAPPPLTDADAPADDGARDIAFLPGEGDDDEGRFWGDPLEDHHASRALVPAWPAIPAVVPASPGTAPSTKKTGPPTGLLDLSVSWATLICASSAPGSLGRIGPITARQARELARRAAIHYATQWRIILTDSRGRAIAVSRIPRTQPPADALPGIQGNHLGLVGRVTVTFPATGLDGMLVPDPDSDAILAAILRTAADSRERAAQTTEADLAAAGGCAHTASTSAYRPSPLIREYVIARDVTCRFPYCGQPAWRGDLDHTKPWLKGGRTCSCNLGPLCRFHHILKQLLGWSLTQPRPGVFQWTTPAGRVYTVGPDLQVG